MELTMEYEFQPQGAVLVHTGEVKQDEGGSWRPVVFQHGPSRYQCGVVQDKTGSKAILHRAVLDEFEFARQVAEELARIAAA
jgi:hypothetical protein